MIQLYKTVSTLCSIYIFIGFIPLEAEEVRAAFDVGSGQTKISVANVDETTGRPLQTLFSDETPLLLGHDLKQSKEGKLSESILAKLEDIISNYKKIALKLGAREMAGVATAVFRESKNGADFIHRLREKTDINFQLISQKKEGELGFLTAVAASGESADHLVAWDSGGASFQITMSAPEGLIVYEGPWGASKALSALIKEVQGKDFSKVSSPNPASLEEVIRLKKLIQESLPQAPIKLLGKIRDLGSTVIAIGGPYSPFKIASIATGKTEYTKEEIWNALHTLIGSTDQQLKAFPEPEMVIPRLTLLISVMDHFEIGKVRYIPTVGSTWGIFISPEFWKIPAPESARSFSSR